MSAFMGGGPKMMKSGVGPSGGFMNKIGQSFGGGQMSGGDERVALSSALNQGASGMFAGAGNFFGGVKDPYKRLADMGYQVDRGQTQPEGQPMMEPPMMPQNPVMAPYGGGQDMSGQMDQRGSGIFGRMKQAMMNRPRPQLPPQSSGGFNRRPMMNRGIGPSAM